MEPADVYRIPGWLALKALYTFAPIGLLFRLAAWRGTIDSRFSPARHKVLATLETFERQLGTDGARERRRLVRLHFQARRRAVLARIWPQIRSFSGSEAIATDGFEHLDAALARGNGAIVATAHHGYARLIKPVLRARGYDVLLVGRRPPNPARDFSPPLTRLGHLVHSRILGLPRWSRHDERYLATVGEDLGAGLNIRPHVAALARNAVLVILADGHAAGMRRSVSVCGARVLIAPGAFSLARASGAEVLPAFVVDDLDRRGSVRLRLAIKPPLDLRVTDDVHADLDAGAEQFGALLEAEVRRHPHLWRALERGPDV